MNGWGLARKSLLWVALVGIALLPVWPNWMLRDLPFSHDGFRYALLADMFVEAQQAGVFYPRWLPFLNGSWGYPTFVFYQPGYFFVAALFSWLTEDFLLRQLLALSLIALVGGLGMYRLARCWLGPVFSLVAVAVFQLAPYSHVNLYLRGDLSEWMALQLLPWPLFFLKRYLQSCEVADVRERCIAWAGLAISSGLVFYTHPIAVIFLPVVLTLMAFLSVLHSPPQGGGARVKRVSEPVAALLTGLALSSPYWASTAVMKPFVNARFATEGFYAATSNLVELKTLLVGSFLTPQSFNQTEFLGLPFFLLACFGAWRGRKDPLVFAAAVVYALLLLAMTAPGKVLWLFPPFSYLQFPWRLATFAPLLQTVCMFGLLSSSEGKGLPSRASLGAMVIAGLIALAAYSPLRNGFVAVSSAVPHDVFSVDDLACLRAAQRVMAGEGATLDGSEWLPVDMKTGEKYVALPARGEPLDASCHLMFSRFLHWWLGANPSIDPNRLEALRSRPWVEFSSPLWTASPEPENTPFRLAYRLDGREAADLVVNQIYLPGWRVFVDGREIPRQAIEGKLHKDGRIRVPIDPGNHVLIAWYDGPLYSGLRNLLVLTVVFGAFWYWRRQFAIPPRISA